MLGHIQLVAIMEGGSRFPVPRHPPGPHLMSDSRATFRASLIALQRLSFFVAVTGEVAEAAAAVAYSAAAIGGPAAPPRRGLSHLRKGVFA